MMNRAASGLNNANRVKDFINPLGNSLMRNSPRMPQGTYLDGDGAINNF